MQKLPLFVSTQNYLEYIRGLPINDPPEIFGLHENANITFAQNETFALLSYLLQFQPRSSAASGSGQQREDVVEEIARSLLQSAPQPFDLAGVVQKYPVMYEQSMNTVLTQEVIRYVVLSINNIQQSQLIHSFNSLTVYFIRSV